MRKTITLFLLTLILLVQIQAQNVGIGTFTPDASARLDISDTARGILIPRMTAAQRNAMASPAIGLLVFVTDDNSFYFFKNGWQKLVAANETWGLSGNTGTNAATHFIGTTDPQPLLFRVNNTKSGEINPNSLNTSLGFNSNGSITSGNNNASLGAYTMLNTTSGEGNVAVGALSLFSNNTGSFNVGIGLYALDNNIQGSENVSVGYSAGLFNTAGNHNTLLGAEANVASSSLQNATAIGFGAQVATSNSLVLGGTAANAVNVGIGTVAPREKLDINGVITITSGNYAGVGNNAGVPVPAGGAGTIIYSNGHFLGWNGSQWKQLDN